MDWVNAYRKAAMEHATLAALRILQGNIPAARERLAEAVHWLNTADVAQASQYPPIVVVAPASGQEPGGDK